MKDTEILRIMLNQVQESANLIPLKYSSYTVVLELQFYIKVIKQTAKLHYFKLNWYL